MRHNKEKNIKSGFTLIELSIVVIIIGLLIGGIVIGQKMVSLSRVNMARTLTNSSPVNGIENLALWLETTSKKSFNKTERIDETDITTWYDINPQLTTKRDLAQSTANLQPILILPSMDFLHFNLIQT